MDARRGGDEFFLSGLRVKLTSNEQVRLGRPRSVNREAYEAYLQGRHFWNKRTRESVAW
jgi:hypothetical protein